MPRAWSPKPEADNNRLTPDFFSGRSPTINTLQHDLPPCARADARRASGNHRQDRGEIANASCCLDSHHWSHKLPYERDVSLRRASGPEAGRRLDEVGAGGFRKRARRRLLVGGQQSRLDDRLAEGTALTTRGRHSFDIASDV